MKNLTTIISGSACALAIMAAAPAYGQRAGDSYVRVAAARTKLVDKGTVATNGVVNPADGYKTRETFHGVLTGGYFVIDGVSLETSITTPATTDNVPAGALAGLPNLGDDEFTVVTLGANVQPLHGRVSPFVGAGYARHFTTQERDGLGVNLNVPNTSGPYVQGGVDVAFTARWGAFASVRKTWYTTNATGKLPLDATYTQFAQVDAKAQLDPVQIQVGLTARFGKSVDAAAGEPIGTDTTLWTLRGGLTSITLADKVQLNVGGSPYAGAGLSTYEQAVPTLQIGRFLTPNIAANLTVGMPPSFDIHGAGSIGALPTLGKVTTGIVVLTAQYHPLRSGRVRPYVGAGIAYSITMKSRDGAFQNLKVTDDVGPALEAGTDLMVSQHWALFADVKKAFLRPKAYGNFNGAAVVGQTRLDPWAFSGGVAFHF